MKENLRALEVGYYVYGGLICLLGFIPLLYVAVGTFFSGSYFAEHAHNEFPHFVGPLMVLIGFAVFVFIEAWGILNIMSGRMIANRRGKVYSFIIAGINCFGGGILGIALGVCTFIMLTKTEVQAEYQAHRELLTDRAY